MQLTRELILTQLKDNYQYLKSEYGLKKIGIFGSYAKNIQNAESDIDIIAEFDKPIGFKFMDFTEYLENLFDKKTEVLTPDGIEGIRNKKIAREIKETIIYV